jgi:hypothetical protein
VSGSGAADLLNPINRLQFMSNRVDFAEFIYACMRTMRWLQTIIVLREG